MSFVPAGPIDHVGIAVRDLDRACAIYEAMLGAELNGREVVAEQGVEVAFMSLPADARVELIAPIDETGPLARFLEERGEGMHHLCVVVDDIDATLRQLAAADVVLIDEQARPGAEGSRIAFVHPQALGGVLLELKQKGD